VVLIAWVFLLSIIGVVLASFGIVSNSIGAVVAGLLALGTVSALIVISKRGQRPQVEKPEPNPADPNAATAKQLLE
jgi:hypothetical protein